MQSRLHDPSAGLDSTAPGEEFTGSREGRRNAGFCKIKGKVGEKKRKQSTTMEPFGVLLAKRKVKLQKGRRTTRSDTVGNRRQTRHHWCIHGNRRHLTPARTIVLGESEKEGKISWTHGGLKMEGRSVQHPCNLQISNSSQVQLPPITFTAQLTRTANVGRFVDWFSWCQGS